ncbi:MAG: SAP domain-containing protein, partial [Candidatus Poseidoniales archaeon]|nr:SAP domain-containing protein [Candidatus Poseidoniales archaeon]
MVTQSSDELMKLKKADLVAIAKEKDLSTAGSKSELVKRIIALTFDEDLVPEQEEEVEPENTIQLEIESDVEPTDNDESSDVVEDIEPPVHRVFTELPKRSFIAGGHHAKPFIATLIVTFVLIFSYGFQDYYRENFYLEGIGAKDGLDCIYTFEHEGNGNHTDYNPEHQDNIDCADIFTKAGYTWYTANYWQENMDEWLQSILAAAQSGGGDENSSGFIWTQVGIDTMAYLGATTFSQNMSVYGDPVAGDEFTGEHLAIWNGFTLAMGGGNDTFESLLPGGNSPFAIYMPAGIVGNAPTGYIWTQAGIDTMAYLGATTFNQNMSVYGDPVAGEVFTNKHLAIWNGFTLAMGGGNDTFESLLPGGNSPFAVYMPAGIVGNAPTGYVWTQAGIETMAYLGATTFNQNMSVYGDPVTGEVFTNNHLATWNGFTSTFPGGGNDTFDGLLPGGNSPFAVFMPTGIVITTVEWFNQTPIVSNVTITENTSENVTTFSCDYVFDDVQGDNDTSFVQWYVDNTTSTNGTNYSSAVTTGTVL